MPKGGRFVERKSQKAVVLAKVFLGLWLLGSAGVRAATDVSDVDAGGQAKVVHRATIYAHPSADPYDPANHYGFNHAPSVVRLPDGRLLAAWFSGPYEASVNQVILASYSSDQGTSWSPPVVLQDFPRKSDFDPSFIADGQRTWFFFSAGRLDRLPSVKDAEHEIGPDSFSTYYRYSDDSGRTWSAPAVASVRHFCRSNGVRLSTRELLLPLFRIVEGHEHSGVTKSVDGGKTWKEFGDVTSPANADEPSIAETSSGAVLMIIRTNDGFLWQTVSRDKGETWAPAQKTEIVAANTSHNLFRLSDSRLVLTNNESPKHRTPLTLRVSSNEGAKWSEPLILAETNIPAEDDPVWDRQVSYPSVAELPDGSLVVVWSEIVLGDFEQYGNIQAARVILH